jgi:hypothetical protein
MIKNTGLGVCSLRTDPSYENLMGNKWIAHRKVPSHAGKQKISKSSKKERRETGKIANLEEKKTLGCGCF